MAWGYLYLEGFGVTVDYDNAYFWYRKAADQGNAFSMNSLGRTYQNGWGRPKDEKQGIPDSVSAIGRKRQHVWSRECGEVLLRWVGG